MLISNLSSSDYGNSVLNDYGRYKNIILINGLYIKPELDLIRKKCKAYIHTHTLCGTAPSLVEMIISRVPVFSIDRPQNRFTLNNQAYFYNNFNELQTLINSTSDFNRYIPPDKLCQLYNWDHIVKQYESLY